MPGILDLDQLDFPQGEDLPVPGVDPSKNSLGLIPGAGTPQLDLSGAQANRLFEPNFADGYAPADNYAPGNNYSSGLTKGILYSPQPQQQESHALPLGLLAAGLGILAHNTGNYGQAGPAIGRGGMLGVQTYLNVKEQEQQQQAMQQHLAQAQGMQAYQQALKNAYVLNPQTNEVDVAATRRNLAQLDPRLAMRFDREQQQQLATQTNLTRRNELAQSLILERRAHALKNASENALRSYFGVIQNGGDENKARQAAQAQYVADIGGLQKQMILPADFRPAEFDPDQAMQHATLMTDTGEPVSGEDSGYGMVPTAATPPMPASGEPKGDWAKHYAFTRLNKINPATALVVLDYRTGQPIANDPLMKQKERLAEKGRTQVTAAGGDVILPTGANANHLQREIVDTQDQIARIANVQSSFKPEYLQLPTQLAMKGLQTAERMGLPLTEQQRTSLEDYSNFTMDAYDNMNRYIKFITGAQMGEREADRIRKSVPDPETDSPTQFKAKMERSAKILTSAGQRYMDDLQHGLSIEQAQRRAADYLVTNMNARTKPQPTTTPKPQGKADDLKKRYGLQ